MTITPGPGDRKELHELAGSREFLSAVIESVPNPLFYKGTDGVYLDCNRAFTDFIGVPKELVVGATVYDLVPRELADLYRAADERLLQGETQVTIETQSLHACGEMRDVILHKSAIVGKDGQVHGVVGVILDITPHKRIEQELHLQTIQLEQEMAEHQRSEAALREREQMLSLVINTVPQAIFWKDTHSVFKGCNEVFARAASLSSPPQVVGKTDYDLPWLEVESDAYRADDREVMTHNRPRYHIIETLTRADGRQIDLDITKIPLHGCDGAVMGVLGVFEDVTERRRAEEALRASEARLRIIFETSQAGIILVSPRGEIDFANARMAELVGLPPGELTGTRYTDYIHPDQKATGDSMMKRLIEGEIQRVTTERRYLRKDGTDFWGYLSGQRLENPDGSLQAIVGIIADITGQKRAKDELEEEKERLAVTLRSIGDGVITVDMAGRVVLVNRVAETLCGWSQEEARGKPLDTVFRIIGEKGGIPLENPVEGVLRCGATIESSNQTLLVARDGVERVIADSAAPILDHGGRTIGAVLVFRDMTEKRAIEEELFRTRKLESLGVLAGGIAHDFNNLLTGIMSNMSLARLMIPEEHEVFPLVDRALKASQRAQDLTHQLLTFSRGGAPVKKLSSIAHLLTDSALFSLHGSNVRCELSIPDDLWPAEIDAGQMSQVINNLVINADQAMPDGGVLTIRAENLPETKSLLGRQVRGRHLRITIEDTGVGIPAELLGRIFDPYFTTKQHGSGLGLATVYSIVKNHGGEIDVYSRVGAGTTFVIRLPASDRPLPPSGAAPARRATGRGKILFMDDDELIRESLSMALKILGYEPVVCADGAEAVSLFKRGAETGAPFTAVIMDLTVPGKMGGKEAVGLILALDPQARVIVSSGYSNDPVMARYEEHGFCGAIRKPYNCQELGAVLERVIGEG